jgi:protein-tyrosine phosphatase
METSEQDWKNFRDMIPHLRERYLAERNKTFSEILNNPDRTPTEQFWDTLEAMNKQKKILADCLDGHSRSNMDLSIMLMLSYGIMKEEDLEIFSEELQEWIRQGRQ